MSAFTKLMFDAERELWRAFEEAGVFAHGGDRGSARESALAKFIDQRLPERFCVTSGEAIDSAGNRTGQLDLAIFDRNMTAPLLRGDGLDLLPAEALLAVVEVKSTLDREDYVGITRGAKAVADLLPYGKKFVRPRSDGAGAEDGAFRCQYSVVAYSSDLGGDEWLVKESARLSDVATEQGAIPGNVERLTVLDRGILLPAQNRGRALSAGEAKVMLREWFVHLTNFVIREANRRPAFDFQGYARRPEGSDWARLYV